MTSSETDICANFKCGRNQECKTAAGQPVCVCLDKHIRIVKTQECVFDNCTLSES